ncbi:MAG: hypothetical protein ACREHV_05655 [Rhizomicrobium sp.]
MSTIDDERPPTREELIRARDDLQRQLDTLRNPLRSRDRSPPLEARLTAMMKEIGECLAAMEPDNTPGTDVPCRRNPQLDDG